MRSAVRAATVLSTGGLLVVVAGVGLFGLLAETQGTWTWYHRMEQVVAAATPVAAGLLVASLLGFFALVAVSGE